MSASPSVTMEGAMQGSESTLMEDFCLYINKKISNVKKHFQLKNIGEEKCLKALLQKLGKDMMVLNDFLDKIESEVNQQEKMKHLLQELQQAAEKDQNEAENLLEHVPPQLPYPTQNSGPVPTVRPKEQAEGAESEPAKKSAKKKRVIKEMSFLTAEEFADVPGYLRGRLGCEQVNAVIEEINKAIVSKYRILHRPVKSMTLALRNLFDRFRQEETKDTKGEFFIVEADIKAFTQLKLEKRFYSILSILRHCHRMREVRSAKVVRYVIC